MTTRTEEFARAFREARVRTGWKFRTAEKNLGISTKTIQNWQQGEWPAQLFSNPDVMKSVCQMMRLSEVELLKLLGFLVNDAGLPKREPFDVMMRLGDVYPSWSQTRRLASRGRLIEVNYHTLIGLDPHPRDIDNFGGPEGLKKHVTGGILRPVWNRAGMHWRSGHPPGWESPPELLIQIPSQERTRLFRPLASETIRRAAEFQVFCVGMPWLHAELLASFVADALSFGYIDLRYNGPVVGTRGPQQDHFSDVVQSLRLVRPGYVMSLSSPKDADDHRELLRQVADDSVVIICTCESLMDSVGSWVYGFDERQSDSLRSFIADLKERQSKVIEVHFRDDDFKEFRFYGDVVQQELSDRACDLALAASVQVVRLLASRFRNVPSPDRWTGHPLNVTDQRGRINWDHRMASTVRWLN